MNKIIDLLSEYKGRIIGAILGLVLAILLLTLGFWRTLLIVILVSTGTAIGYLIDDRTGFYRSMGDIYTRTKKDE